MKNYKKISFLLGAALLLSSCGLIEKVDKNGNPIDPNEPQRIENYDVGEFEGEPITFYDLEKELSPIALTLTLNYGAGFLNGDGKKLHAQLHHTLMNKLIEDRILDRKAEDASIEFDKEAALQAAKERLEEIKSKLGEDFYKGALTGMGFDSEKEYLERLEKEEIRKAFYRAYKSEITVTDKEVEEEFKKNQSTYKKMPGAEIYHIYLGVDKEEAERTGASILQKLKDGATFEEMSKEYGQDGTAKEGGKLGYYNYDTMDLHQDFMEHVKTMKEGEISKVVESTAGFHIIRVLDVTEKEKQLTFEEVKEDIYKNLLNSKLATSYQTDLAKWKEEYTYKIYTDKLPKLEEEKPQEEAPVETPTDTPETPTP